MRSILWLLFSGLIPISILFFILYLFDPYQLYHKPYFRQVIFHKDMNYQTAGIINNYDFNSAILGSSIMVNASSFEANQKLGGKWVNLSIGGANLSYRIEILKYILRKKQIKNLIITLEPEWLNQDLKNNQYLYLYDESKINDFKTYLDEIFIACLFFNNLCLKGQNTLDKPGGWQNSPAIKDRLGGFNEWLKNYENPDIKLIFEKIINFKDLNPPQDTQSIDPNLITLIKSNPNTNFYFIIPPFSRLNYKLSNITIKQALLQLLNLKVSNLKIYGFDTTNIPDNLSHYIDLVHYDESINSLMIDAIKNNSHRITLNNIQSYFDVMQEKIKNFDIESLHQKILKSPYVIR